MQVVSAHGGRGGAGEEGAGRGRGRGPRPGRGHEGGNPAAYATVSVAGPAPGRGAQGGARGRGRRGWTPNGNVIEAPKEDFDVEAANERFQREDGGPNGAGDTQSVYKKARRTPGGFDARADGTGGRRPCSWPPVKSA